MNRKKKKQYFHSNNIIILKNYTARKEVHEGREYLVAPVVILIEGVHCGSAGCFLYEREELAKFPDAWNNRPLPVFHPTDGDGDPVSANSPEAIAENSVGMLFHVHYLEEDDLAKLAGEIWVDVLKSEARFPNVLAIVRRGDPLEVSTGLYSDHEGGSGTWHGEEYQAKSVNIRSDHLALLPGSTGACSLRDGCGVRANEDKTFTVDKEKVISIIKALAKNQIAHEDVRMQLQKEVDKLDVIRQDMGSSTLHFVIAVFDSFFIYRKESPDGVQLFKQDYIVLRDNEIEIREEAKEAREKTTYTVINISNNKKEKKGGRKMCPDKIKALIENEDSKFTEDDRKWLEGLDDNMADKLEPVLVEKKNPTDKSDKDVKTYRRKGDKEKDELKAQEEAKKKADELKAQEEEDKGKKEPELNEEDREALEYGKGQLKEKTDLLVKAILGNARNKFEEKELREKKIGELEKLAEFANVEIDFSANVGGKTPDANTSAGEVLEIPDMVEVKA